MKLKYFYSIVFFLLYLVIFSENTFACSGIFPEKPVCVKYGESDVVLIGEVIKTTIFTKNDEDEDEDRKFRRTTFKVEKQFKGRKQETIEFITPTELRTSCDYWIPKFEIGEKWVLYGFSVGDEMKLNLQDYSWKYDPTENKEDIEFLENAALGIRETTLHLQIDDRTNIYPESIGVLDINVSGKDFDLFTQTTKHGTLIIPNLRDGLYTISFTSPKDSYIMNLPPNAKEKIIEDSKQYLIEQEVEIKDGKCIFSHFALGNRN